MKVTFQTPSGSKTVTIKAVDVNMTPANEEKMLRKFNKEVRVIEWVGGCTYHFRGRIKDTPHNLKSSSLDELQEMFKAAWCGLPVPERKCHMIAKK